MPTELPSDYLIRNATLHDIAAAGEVCQACELADIGELDMSVDWLHDDWTRPRFDQRVLA